jgi:hypothetical protein
MDLGTLAPAQRALADKIVEKCIVSRMYFIKEILGVKHIEDWQQEALEALDRGETKLSIRSGHGVGKTCFCAWTGIHYLLFRSDVKVIITSPSFKQMTDGLIPEITKWVNRMPDWMSGSINITSDRMTREPDPKNNFISFRTARKENPEALAGVHAENVLIIVDEASGVDEVIYETGQGALSTKGALAILIGNPTNPSGFFFKTQTTLSDLWWARKVSCMDSSRVDESYIASQLRTYGADSREYAVRVLGEFPESGADSVIPRSFAEGALHRDVNHINMKGIMWGVDPGRGGDPTGFVERSANRVTEIKELKYVDLMQVVGWVKKRWDNTPEKLKPESIFVDTIGLGAGVADRLSELGLPVIAVNVSESSSLSSRFVRLRPELWYSLRAWLERRDVSIDNEQELSKKLVEEMVSINQILMSNGKVDVESKVDMKKRGMPSPNIADALCMTFAFQGAVMSGSYNTGGWGNTDTSKYVVPHVV